jgi:ABC-type phosphate transport system substrate-binding protein
VRALRLAALSGMRYWTPDLEAVHNGDYPLTRVVYNYVRADGARLANGFITFITSRDGQEIVHEAGLVPTTVPVRFVRRSPMQSSHREEKPTTTP